MGKILSLILGLAVVAFLGYQSMYGRTGPDKATPQERLQNVKEAAKRIEVQQQQRADQALEHAAPKE